MKKYLVYLGVLCESCICMLPADQTSNTTPHTPVFTHETAHAAFEDITEVPAGNTTFTGYGKRTNANGVFVGDFVEGMFQGRGTFSCISGDRYVGDFVAGMFHGRGTFSYIGGDRYVGDFADGKRHGRGIYNWRSGAVYDGEYVRDQRTGYGTYSEPDVATYVGSFDHDQPHGYVTVDFLDNSRGEGICEHGMQVGLWKLTGADGTVSTARFRET